MVPESELSPVFAPHGDGRKLLRTPKIAELVARRLRGMIVDGELKEGDHLPNEAELMVLFSVSRPTLREAIRVLESERLVEVRRGSRAGAEVRIPGPEIVARPASLLLELSGATVADVNIALAAVEPLAARLLAAQGTDEQFDELERILDEDMSNALTEGGFVTTAAQFHLKMVEFSGSPTLALISGMVHEIFERNNQDFAERNDALDRDAHEQHYKLFLRSQRKFLKLLRARDVEGAAKHWRKHLEVMGDRVLEGRENVKVRDLLG